MRIDDMSIDQLLELINTSAGELMNCVTGRTSRR